MWSTVLRTSNYSCQAEGMQWQTAEGRGERERESMRERVRQPLKSFSYYHHPLAHLDSVYNTVWTWAPCAQWHKALLGNMNPLFTCFASDLLWPPSQPLLWAHPSDSTCENATGLMFDHDAPLWDAVNHVTDDLCAHLFYALIIM